MKGKGKCLCGLVKLEVEYASNELAACHCNMCRNWSGGPMLAIDCADSVKISGESNVVRFQSSQWAQRGFCGTCGTHLFYFLVPNNQYHLPVGLLMSEDRFKFTHQIFIDEKPEYYTFKNETHNMTGEEIFAHFESGEQLLLKHVYNHSYFPVSDEFVVSQKLKAINRVLVAL